MAAIRQRITHIWSAVAGSSRPVTRTTIFVSAARSRPAFSAAPFSTVPHRAWPDASKLSLDHEIRRPQREHQLRSLHKEGKTATEAVGESSDDWLDVWNDSAEAEEAIRAYREDGVVLGLSNTGGQLNFIDEDAATNVDCGGLTDRK